MIGRHVDSRILWDRITVSPGNPLTTKQRLALAQLIADHPVGFRAVKMNGKHTPLPDYAKSVLAAARHTEAAA